MNSAPFDVQPVIARLRATVPALRQVAGVASYATLRGLQDYPTPGAYVLLAREKAQPNPPGNGLPGQQVAVRQRVAVTFGVVLAVRNFREQQGMQSADPLRELLGSIRGALLGWVPEVTGARPCSLVQGELSAYDASTVLWTDVWQTQTFVGSDPA